MKRRTWLAALAALALVGGPLACGDTSEVPAAGAITEEDASGSGSGQATDEAGDGRDAGDGQPDATPDAPADAEIVSCGPVESATPSTDCWSVSECGPKCAAGFGYRCSGSDPPLGRGCLQHNAVAPSGPGGWCCPIACVRRASRDGECADGRTWFSCPAEPDSQGGHALVEPSGNCVSMGLTFSPTDTGAQYCCL